MFFMIGYLELFNRVHEYAAGLPIDVDTEDGRNRAKPFVMMLYGAELEKAGIPLEDSDIETVQELADIYASRGIGALRQAVSTSD